MCTYLYRFFFFNIAIHEKIRTHSKKVSLSGIDNPKFAERDGQGGREFKV